jgi:hypothetical protein
MINALETEKHISDNISSGLEQGEKDASKELRKKLEEEHKRSIADFIGLCFVDTIVRMTCRGPVHNGLPPVDSLQLSRIFDAFTDGKDGEVWGGYDAELEDEVLYSAGIVGLADDLYSATLFATRPGGKYVATDPVKIEPLAMDDAADFIHTVMKTAGNGTVGEVKEEDIARTSITKDTFTRWVESNALLSYSQRKDVREKSYVHAQAMTMLERLAIATASRWNREGYVNPPPEAGAENSTDRDGGAGVSPLKKRSAAKKEKAKPPTGWKADPRLAKLHIEEVPVKLHMVNSQFGSGIVVATNMRITKVRAYSDAANQGLRVGDILMRVEGGGKDGEKTVLAVNDDESNTVGEISGDAAMDIFASAKMYPLQILAIRDAAGRTIKDVLQAPPPPVVSSDDDDDGNEEEKQSGDEKVESQAKRVRETGVTSQARQASRARRDRERSRLAARRAFGGAEHDRWGKECALQQKKELEKVCDDTESAWTGTNISDSKKKTKNVGRGGRGSPLRKQHDRSQMAARVEALRAVEESEFFMGDKLAEKDSHLRIRSLGFEQMGQDGLVSRGQQQQQQQQQQRREQQARSSQNSPRTRRIGRDQQLASAAAAAKTQRNPQPPAKSQRRRHWHLFHPDPSLAKKRKKILQERRKRNEWRKAEQQRQQRKRRGQRPDQEEEERHQQQQPPLILGSLDDPSTEQFSW